MTLALLLVIFDFFAIFPTITEAMLPANINREPKVINKVSYKFLL